ncbi:MAG TPA: hypothetical protein VGX25_00540 [Actinophytocola sp.]|uniref:hypothetical protein n=1 Tax=Actinophytocola sp. TaxID=1872138 RepID=UPI002DDD981F|nr:hypothetical protein [Actinophytocola sp.]HEV2777866.1 hypothetical protein [Actinophytocola sp.]
MGIVRNGHEASDRWSYIRRFLGGVAGIADDFLGWWWRGKDTLSPAELAAAHEQWADRAEWRLAQRAEELASDRIKRYLVTSWTDSVAYTSRRLAAQARGELSEWIPQRERRPDLHTEARAIFADILTELNIQSQPTKEQSSVVHLRKAG